MSEARNRHSATGPVGVLRETIYKSYAFDPAAIKAAFPEELAEFLADGQSEEEFLKDAVENLLDPDGGFVDHATNGRLVWQVDDDAEWDWEIP